MTTAHPSAVVGPGVELGVDVSIGPHAVLTGPLQVGDRVVVGAGATIGGPPEITSARQNLGWNGDLAHQGVVVEDDVVIRELVVVHQGSARPTRVGRGSWLLNRCYLAHDVVLGASVIVSAGVSIGGDCTVGDGATIGMNASLHQGRSVGRLAMVGMGTPVSRDVPPFATVYGTPPRIRRVNRVGMLRAGLSEDLVAAVETALADGDARLVDDDLARAELASWWAAPAERRMRVEVSAGDRTGTGRGSGAR